jgi:hypothetical protein
VKNIRVRVAVILSTFFLVSKTSPLKKMLDFKSWSEAAVPPGIYQPVWDLPQTYIAWLITLVLLYPFCQWFAQLKARRNDWWLSYL